MRVELRAHRLPLREPLRTAVGLLRERAVLEVVVSGGGAVGRGEAAPLPGFSEETVEEAAAALAAWAPPPPGSLASLDGSLPEGPPSARHGAEQALLEWWAAREGRSVCELLGGPPDPAVPVHRVVADPAQAAAAVADGVRALKLKVAARPLAEDLARVRAVREAVGPDVALRLDANRGWSPELAAEALRALAPLGVELVEEPTAGLAALAALRGRVAIGADESIRSEADLEAVLAAGAADVVVIKPMFVGGLRASVRMLRRARAAGLGALVTTVFEGGVGRRGALDVAAAGPASLACGLDTGGWLASDLDPGPEVVGGVARRRR